MHRLRIAVFSDVSVAGSEWQWVALDSANCVLAQGQGDPGQWAQTRDVEVLLPASRLVYRQLTVPAASRRQLSKILPFALEDEQLTPPDGSHLAAGVLQGDSVAVAMVARDYLLHLLRRLAEFSIQPRRVVSVLDCLPSDRQDIWHVLLMPGDACARAAQSTFSFDFESTPPVELQLALRQAITRPQSLQVYVAQGLDIALLAGWQGELGIDLQSHPEWDWRVAPLNAGAINLLQGAFARSSVATFDWRVYRLPAMLLSALILLYATSVVVDWWRLDRQYTRISAAIEAEARKVIPVGPLVDPVAQLQRKQQDVSRNGAVGWAALAQLLAAQLGSSSLTRFHYADGTALIELSLPDAAQAEALQQRLANAGLQVERKNGVVSYGAYNVALLLKDAR